MIREEIRQIRSGRRELRNFGLIVGGVLVLLGGLALTKRSPAGFPFLAAGGTLIVSGLLFPILLKPLQKAWMAGAVVLGWLMSRVLLTGLFFLILTPLGLLAKLFRKRFLELRPNHRLPSYWNIRPPAEYRREDSEKQF